MTTSTVSPVTIVDHGEERLVVVRGAITEAIDFSAALAPGPKRVLVDLSGVDRINSFGVREWVRFLKTLAAGGVSCALDAVSVPMVRQMNMIPQARGGAEVRAIFAPYYCATCDDERTVKLASGARTAAERAHCPTCGAEMEFDDVVDGYFAFLAGDPAR